MVQESNQGLILLVDTFQEKIFFMPGSNLGEVMKIVKGVKNWKKFTIEIINIQTQEEEDEEESEFLIKYFSPQGES